MSGGSKYGDWEQINLWRTPTTKAAHFLCIISTNFCLKFSCPLPAFSSKFWLRFSDFMCFPCLMLCSCGCLEATLSASLQWGSSLSCGCLVRCLQEPMRSEWCVGFDTTPTRSVCEWLHCRVLSFWQWLPSISISFCGSQGLLRDSLHFHPVSFILCSFSPLWHQTGGSFSHQSEP